MLSSKDLINKYSYFFLAFILKNLFSLEGLILYRKHYLGC